MINERLSFINYSHTYYVAGFSPNTAVNSVTIKDIEPGEIVCLMGQNGSGKSTLLDAILGVFPDNSGSVEIEGRIGKKYDSKPKFAYIPQKPHDGLVFDMSIIENVALKSVFHSGPNLKKAVTKTIRDEIIKYIEECDFTFLIDKLEMPPVALSGGEQQIVNIVGAIIAKPDVIICDEPTSKLDEQNRIRVSSLLLKAAHENKVRVFCATHDQELADRIADRIITLNKGNIERSKSLREPCSRRWVGGIRLVDTVNKLPKICKKLSNNWWEPAEGSLFDEDYYNGDDSYIGYLAQNPLERTKRTLREVNGALRYAKIENKGNLTIADIPCGWGRHTIELAKLGHNVIAIDLSAKYIEMLRKNCVNIGPGTVDIQNSDMRNLHVEDETCDLVVNLWTSFGFFSDEQNKSVLREFTRIVKPGGKILIHSDLNPERIRLGIFDEPPIRELKNGNTLFVYEYYCEENHSVYGTWKIGTDGRTHVYKIIVYSIRAWEEMAKYLGLTIEGIYGGLDERDGFLNDQSQEFVIVLAKNN